MNLDQLGELFPEGGDVTVDDLVAKGAVRKGQPVKVLGQGDLSVARPGERPGVLRLRQGEDRGRRRHRHRSSEPVRRASRSAAFVAGRRPVGRPWPLSGFRRLRGLPAARDALRRHTVHAGEQEERVLSAFVERVPDSGPAQEAAVRPVHHRALPARARQIPAPGVNVGNVQTCIDDGQRTSGVYNLINLFSGGALLQLTIFALGHHALHHREHHPAAARRGDPAARGAEEGGPVRPDQDHPVHPLPDARPGACSRRPASWRWPARAACSRAATRTLLYERQHPDLPDHGHHDDRRHRRDHVARRADHRPRHRQRHVDPDLHPGRRDASRPRCGRSARPTAGGPSRS